MNAGIYKIENVVNGHCYIGQSVNLRKRNNDHFQRLEKNKHHNRYLQRAYKKHGKENFVFSILLYCEDFELTYYEQYFVDKSNPEYNICRDCVDSTKGIKLSEEQKQKMSLYLTGIKRSEESKRNISLGHKGIKFSREHKQNLRRTITKEHKEKLSLAMTGKKHSEETKQKLSLAKTGKKRAPFSDEHKQKMSLATKEQWKRQKAQQSLFEVNRPKGQVT